VVAHIDTALCERLAAQGCAGDVRARQQLAEHLYPFWLGRVVYALRRRRLPASEDEVYDVVTRLVVKLMTESTLCSYLDWKTRTAQGFFPWICEVSDNELTEHVRRSLGRSSKRREPGSDALPSPKRLLNQVMASPTWEESGHRPPATAVQTVIQLVEFAEKEFPPPQVQALKLWLQGATFEEIDQALAVESGRGRELIRAALARFRRHFRLPDDALDDAG
jgi:hypothetical protein